MAATLTSTGITFSDGTSTNTNLMPTGTLMLFQQTSAPTGWTKQTTHDNKALRVVSGTAGSGGSTAFTSVFTSRTPAGSVAVSNAAFTLTTNEIPSHTHSYTVSNLSNFGSPGGNVSVNMGGGGSNTGSAGGGGSHTHANTATFSGTALDFAVQYVDLIIASKN